MGLFRPRITIFTPSSASVAGKRERVTPFGRRLTIFLAGLCAMLVLASIYYEVRVRQTSLFFSQVEWFSSPEVQPFVLFIGDSRMALNLDPQLLPPGYYNWSYPGDTLRHTYLRARYALKTKPSIRYLVIGLEDLTLSEPRARLRDVFNHMLFSDLVALTEAYPSSARFLLRSAMLHHMPLINATYRRQLGESLAYDAGRLLTGRPPEQRLRLQCGTQRFAQDRNWSEMDEATRHAETRETVDEMLGAENDVPEMRELLLRLLQLAADHDVKIIGVRSPLSAPYLDAARKYDTASVKSFYRSLPLRTLFDYEEAYADRIDYFRDEDHLNGRGATAYTRRLVTDLRQIVETAPGAAAACDVTAPAPLRWPYNDVVSEWLRTPACHNLRGDCGVLPPARQPSKASPKDRPPQDRKGQEVRREPLPPPLPPQSG
jgi:hypothetical protein